MSLPEFFKKLKQDYCGGGLDPNDLHHLMNPFIAAVPGHISSDPTAAETTFDQWELLAHALMAMVLKGRIEEEKVNSFNLPYYASCEEELNLVLQKKGPSRLEMLEIDGGDRVDQDRPNNTAFDDDQMITSSGQRAANGIRVLLESMLESHFGKEIMDDLFQRYAELPLQLRVLNPQQPAPTPISLCCHSWHRFHFTEHHQFLASAIADLKAASQHPIWAPIDLICPDAVPIEPLAMCPPDVAPSTAASRLLCPNAANIRQQAQPAQPNTCTIEDHRPATIFPQLP
ncbi:hypothetical protein M0R45_020205 [Rubus argutus]|uniref:SRR1-like domain-containing protein n=1 Tax=Rubus argutus TaxID=59490 RepID=A0AAW1X918_RUBAR